jgi:hypothetical protein
MGAVNTVKQEGIGQRSSFADYFLETNNGWTCNLHANCRYRLCIVKLHNRFDQTQVYIVGQRKTHCLIDVRWLPAITSRNAVLGIIKMTRLS